MSPWGNVTLRAGPGDELTAEHRAALADLDRLIALPGITDEQRHDLELLKHASFLKLRSYFDALGEVIEKVQAGDVLHHERWPPLRKKSDPPRPPSPRPPSRPAPGQPLPDKAAAPLAVRLQEQLANIDRKLAKLEGGPFEAGYRKLRKQTGELIDIERRISWLEQQSPTGTRP